MNDFPAHCLWSFGDAVTSSIDSSHLIDIVAAESDASVVPIEISIVLKRNKDYSLMGYFVRFHDISQVGFVQKEFSSDENKVLMGEDSLEDLLSVSLNLSTKTSWAFRGSRVLVDNCIIVIGHLDHGAGSSKRICLVEIIDLKSIDLKRNVISPETTQSPEMGSNSIGERLSKIGERYLGRDIMGRGKLVGEGIGGTTSTQQRTQRWIQAVNLLH